MQLGEVIRGFDDEANAAEALVACGDVALLARVDAMTSRFGETVGEYASGAVRRFASLAGSEDWLGLMNILERASDPAAGRWTCELKGQGSTDEAGDLMVEFEDGSLTFKIVGKELRVAPGEGVAERLAGACGAGGSLAGAYLK